MIGVINIGKKVGKGVRKEIGSGVVYCWRENSFCFGWGRRRGKMTACNKKQVIIFTPISPNLISE
ncbi:hypothetical protein NIES2119_31980 [[Phormidium ambiguum] IAM M-71]|uniref:Uncharacterized protein n=1 Tax=[Phormidium ambiguum] IAM M-71 TaxID=454136 RepID=A0A1U7I1D7_9CYAN|nr:hypothetical protein NIES2119_31980 [Phormidium ambiguum IAM M-71]